MIAYIIILLLLVVYYSQIHNTLLQYFEKKTHNISVLNTNKTQNMTPHKTSNHNNIKNQIFHDNNEINKNKKKVTFLV